MRGIQRGYHLGLFSSSSFLSLISFLCISFFPLSLLFFSGCAKEIRGAGSVALPQPISEPLLYPTYEISPEQEGFKFGFGASNLKPFLFAGYSKSNFVGGLALTGIPYSGVNIVYNTIGGDLSFSYALIEAKSGRFFIGGGLGGIFAKDENYSEEGKSHSIFEVNPYLSSVISVKLAGTERTFFFFSFRLGFYWVKSSYLKSWLEKKKEEGEITKITDTFSGLFFSPSMGFVGSILDGKVGWSVSLAVPLSSALLYKPELHPFVPTLTFGFIF